MLRHWEQWAGAVSSHIQFHLLCQGFDPKGVNNLIHASFDLQVTREAAEAVQDKDRHIKTRNKAAAKQGLQMHDKLHSGWVDLMLGMTKAQREKHAWQQAIQESGNDLDRNYNFDDTHSINPTKGRPNDGTAITMTINVSLGETAYDVVQQSDESDLDDIVGDLYTDKENTSNVNLDMNEVHRNTGKSGGTIRSSLSEERESHYRSSMTSDQEEGQENNDTIQISAGGGREMPMVLACQKVEKVGTAPTKMQTETQSCQINPAFCYTPRDCGRPHREDTSSVVLQW